MNNFNHLISRNVSLLTMVGFVVGTIALASAITPGATNTVSAQDDPTEMPPPPARWGRSLRTHRNPRRRRNPQHAGAHLHATTY